MLASGDSSHEIDYRRRSRSRSRERRRRSHSRSRSPVRRRYRSRSRSYGRSPPRKKTYADRGIPEPCNCLGVFGLNHRTNEADLERVFEQFGKLEKVVVVFDKRHNESRGFGFVYFDSVESATKARDSTNGMELDGRSIRVDFSVTKKPHEPTPGYYAGRSDSRRRSPPRRRYRSRSRSRSPYRSSRRRSYSRSRSR